MGIITLLFLFIILIILLYSIFRLIKWISQNKSRVKWVFALLGAFVLAVIINNVFLKKMEFIQSKVYPDLYLIKNPIKDKDSINKAIKEKIVQIIDNNIITKKNAFFTLRFYEYNKGFGRNGTAYFIEHKERRYGMLPELLEYYPEYLLAKFSVLPCKEDNSNYFGKVDYYKEREMIKTDTLLNSCKKGITVTQ